MVFFHIFCRYRTERAKANVQQHIRYLNAHILHLFEQLLRKVQPRGWCGGGAVLLGINGLVALLIVQPLGYVWRQRRFAAAVKHLFKYAFIMKIYYPAARVGRGFNLYTQFVRYLIYKAGNKYSLPYMWGTVGILYNTTMVEEPVTSWGILWDEKYAGQIWMYDSVRDSIGITLKYLGYDLNTRSEAEIAEARDLLIAQKPLRKGFGTDNMRASMINGKAAMAVIYSGDAFVCMDENEDLAYAVPEEGSTVWFDNVVIPKSAKNIEAAHAFINFLNDGAIAARNTEYIYYSTPNQAAMDRLDEYFTGSETYNPPKEVLDRCTVFHDLGDFVSVFNEAWNAIKMK